MIKIITVYNSLNPGSLLQATALYNVIKNKYNDVSFLEIGIRHPFLTSLKYSFKLFFKLKICLSIKQLYMPFKYEAILNKYKKAKKINEDDIFILGSDEIWNVSRKCMAEYSILWGDKLNQKRCISYAPSINDSNLEDLIEYDYVKKSLNNLFSISVRDNYSKKVLSNITNKNISLMCDPTMLVDINNYRRMESKLKIDNFILVYGSEKNFSSVDILEIKDFAKKNNLKIVSYFFYHKWCDKIFYGSPYEFLSLISSAKYVVTSTFHGTIFSIIYNKQFVVFGKNNKKVQELLKEFKLNVNHNDENTMEQILSKDYNYKIVNKIIEKKRLDGNNYLLSNIDLLLAQKTKL